MNLYIPFTIADRKKNPLEIYTWNGFDEKCKNWQNLHPLSVGSGLNSIYGVFGGSGGGGGGVASVGNICSNAIESKKDWPRVDRKVLYNGFAMARVTVHIEVFVRWIFEKCSNVEKILSSLVPCHHHQLYAAESQR